MQKDEFNGREHLIFHSINRGVMEAKQRILNFAKGNNAIVEKEIAIFEKELENMKNLLSNSLSVGTEEQFKFLDSNIQMLTDLYKEEKCCKESLEAKVHNLKVQSNECFAMIGEAGSRNQWNIPGHMKSLINRSLDPVHAKQMRGIKEQYQLVNCQLNEVDTKVRGEWMERLKLPEELQRLVHRTYSDKGPFHYDSSVSEKNCAHKNDSKSLDKATPDNESEICSKASIETNFYSIGSFRSCLSTSPESCYCSDAFQMNNIQESCFNFSNISDVKILKNKCITAVSQCKISTIRDFTVGYNKLLHELSPLEIIREYRMEINKLAEECTSKLEKRLYSVLMNFQRSKSKVKDALQRHMGIMIEQQKTFQQYIAGVSSSQANTYNLDVTSVVNKCEEIYQEVKNECLLLDNFLPIYVMKGEITSLVEKSRVTIILADVLYLASGVVPIFCGKHCQSGMMAVCEPNMVLADYMKYTYMKLTDSTESSGCESVLGSTNKTEIIFTTVEELLHHSVSDSNFSLYSVVILHCELKQTIETDLLLEALKQCIKLRTDFKVVLILSPSHNVVKFTEYFASVTSIGFAVAPDLHFPIRTVWMNCSPTNDYIDKVVETALAIHVLNKAGDVLIFLPSAEDISRTLCKLSSKLEEYSYDDAECLCIYVDYFVEPIMNILNETSNLKRKFILSVSPVEFLILPSVSYVIDTGLVRQVNYDAEKCLEMQKLTFISRAAAKLRKGCAGRYRSGTCYRLYSKTNFCNDMVDYEVSDVLKMNPVETVMKTFQYRPKKAKTIEFIEPLPKEIEKNAISILETATAVKDGELTVLGQEIIKLPFLPNYSKLIILGIHWGFPFEAVLLVAFLSVKSSIFLQGSDVKDSKNLATKKLQFLYGDSDTLTYLNIFHLWMKNNFQREWCQTNFLNYQTLKKVQSKVTEIVNVVRQRLKEDIILEIQDEKTADWCALQEIVFHCFKDNLCVYSGHSKGGYHLFKSRSMAFLDPLSPVVHNGKLPEFVVYNSLVSTSQNFIVSVTAVPKELVFSEIEKGIYPTEMMNLFHAKLESYVIEPVPMTLIKGMFQDAVGKKWHSIEDEVRSEINGDLIVLEPSVERGSVTLYTLPENMKKAKKIVHSILEKESECVISETETRSLELKKNNATLTLNVTWTKGASIIATTLSLGSRHGPAARLRNTDDNENVLPVRRKAINLTWPRRFCSGVGFVCFNSVDFKIARRLSMRTVEVLGKEAVIKVNTSAENQLLVSGLSPVIFPDDLEQAITSMLPNSIAVQKVFLTYEKPFVTTDEDIELYNSLLDEICCCLMSYTSVSSYEITVPKPHDEAKVMAATINLDIATEIEEAVDIINSQFTFAALPLRAEPMYSSVIDCKIEIFNAIQERLMHHLHLIEEQYSDQESYPFQFRADTEDYNVAKLEFSTKSRHIINIFRSNIQELLEGEVINCNAIKDLHKLFTHGGHLWLQALEKTENVYIVDEYKSKTIRVYGSLPACERVVQRVKEFIIDAENEVVSVIDLTQGKNTCALFKILIQKYGTNLHDFIEEFKLRSAEINLRTSQLFLHGCAGSIENARCALKELASLSFPHDGEKEFISSQEACAVCRMSPHLSVRLEHCGHVYCLECHKGLVTYSEPPIQCCAEDCGKELILEDIRKALDYDELQIRNLLEVSLKNYIAKNPHLIYCPAPDCPMFYNESEIGTEKWNCPLCKNDICIKCKVVFHHGYTCEVYQGSKIDADYAYKVWIRDNKANSKQCPSCKAGIEKIAGCNHMTCSSCDSHFCWLCTKSFPTPNMVYDHLPYCPQNQGC